MKKCLIVMIAIMTLLLAGCDTEAETVVATPQPAVTQRPVAEPTPSPVIESDEPESEYPELVVKVQKIISEAADKAANHEAAGADLITQTDMNQHSYELYMIWDDAINEIWALYDKELDRELFYDIQAEQIAWITEKETELQKIRDEYNGGSITALACNTKAAEMTKERIYELVEYVS